VEILAPRWKFLLPVSQSVLAVALWLYIPVQYTKELLQLAGMPSEHPFRVRLEGPQRFPPLCEQVLCAINFPAVSVSEWLVDPLLNRVTLSRQSAFPELEFTLPLSDPEALPPRKVFYFVHLGDVIFLLLVGLLWFWVGCRIDNYALRKAREPWGYIPEHTVRLRASRVTELAIVATLLLFTACFGCWNIAVAQSPQSQRAAEWGLIWPLAFLGYLWLGIRRTFLQRVRQG